MHDFILKNMHLLERLEKTDPTPFSIVPVIDDDIGTYAPKKERDKLISFHGTGIPSYAWKLCCWMSHRSTYRNRKGNSVVIYDDEQIDVVLNGTQANDINIDEDGMTLEKERTIPQKIGDALFGKKPEEQRNILSEMNDAWLVFKDKNTNSLPTDRATPRIRV